MTFDSNQDRLHRNLIKKSKIFSNKIKKSKIIFFLGAHVLFLVFTCIYLIKFRSYLNENFFRKKVITMSITPEFLKTLLQNLTLN